jgi:REP element-mobilizing transposase RayT
MARIPRIERAGAWHHVTARGNERHAIYRDDRDRQHFCELLGGTVELFQWRLHVYVLMKNHFHLLVETPEPNLGRGMQWLNTSYSVWFNRRHERAGHLLQGRFKSIVVDPVGWGLELSRYLHLNPVRVGRLGLSKSERQADRAGAGAKPTSEAVKKRLAELRGYRWSSYRAYIGLASPPRWLERERLLKLGGGRGPGAADRYRRHIEEAIRQGLAVSPWEELRDRTVLGGVDFARRLAQRIGLGKGEKTGARRLARPTVAQIIRVVEAVKGEKWESFRDRHGDWGRDLVFYLGRKEWALKLRELGAAAGGVDDVAVSMAARRIAQRTTKDPALSAALKQSREKLELLNV